MFINSSYQYESAPNFQAKPIYVDPKKLEELTSKGLSYRQIAEVMGISKATAFKYCKKNGINSAISSVQLDYDKFDRGQVETLINEGKSLSQVGKILGVGISTVRSLLKRFGLMTKQAKSLAQIDEAELCALIDMGLSQKEIAKALNIDDPGALTPLIKKYGKKVTQAKVDRIPLSELKMYLKQGFTLEDLGKKYQVSPQYIKKKLENHGLKTQSMKGITNEITKQELMACIEKGMNISDIVKAYSVNKANVIKVLKDNGINIPKKRYPVSKAEVAEAINNSKTYVELSKKLHVSYRTARTLAKHYNLSTNRAPKS